MCPRLPAKVRAGGRQDLALLPGSKQAPNLASLLWALPPASPAPSLPWGTGAPLGHGHLSEVPLSQVPPSAQLLPIELPPPHSSPISASLPPPAIGYSHQHIHLLLTPSSHTPSLHLYSGFTPTQQLPPPTDSLPTCPPHLHPLPPLPAACPSILNPPHSTLPLSASALSLSIPSPQVQAKAVFGIRKQKLWLVPYSLTPGECFAVVRGSLFCPLKSQTSPFPPLPIPRPPSRE